MLKKRNPCYHYIRRRLGARRDSAVALSSASENLEELKAREKWDFCGGFGDDEIAPPFCGGREARLGWEAMLRLARSHAKTTGVDVFVVADAGPLGPGDPFLPPRSLVATEDGVRIYLANFHLRGHALITSLRSAWKFFDKFCCLERVKQAKVGPIYLHAPPAGEILVRQDPRLKLADLYFANPNETALTARWKMARRPAGDGHTFDWPDESRPLTVAPGEASYLDTIFQGEEDWIRYLRIWRGQGRNTHVGSLVLTPELLAQEALSLTWCSYEPEPLFMQDFVWQDQPHPVTRRLALRTVMHVPNFLDDVSVLAPAFSSEDIRRLDRDRDWGSPRGILLHQQHLGAIGPALWVVARLEENRPIGLCGVHRINDSSTSPLAGEYELVCWLLPEARLKGYAYEAACEALRCAFDSFLDFRDDTRLRIWARVDPADERALRLVERLGMTRKDSPSGPAEDSAGNCCVYALHALDFWRRSPHGRLSSARLETKR